jgi:hypothetical protein
MKTVNPAVRLDYINGKDKNAMYTERYARAGW